MDKKIAGLLGAVAGIATMASAEAATEPGSTPSTAPAASSYADLLAPIPNAVEQLKAADAARVQPQNEQVAQYYNNGYNGYGYNGYGYNGYNSGYGYPRYHHHHHHHHHHQQGAIIGIPGVGGFVVR
jgi:hypothetical protein